MLAVNPGKYHSDLTDMSADLINVYNSGIADCIDEKKTSELLETLAVRDYPEVSVNEVLVKAEKGVDNFVKEIRSLLC